MLWVWGFCFGGGSHLVVGGGGFKDLHDRSVVSMEWAVVPGWVKPGIGAQVESVGVGKGLFAVFDKKAGEGKEGVEGDEGKIVIFAPGALYEVLPLWVADGSECEGESVLCRPLSSLLCFTLAFVLSFIPPCLLPHPFTP